MTAFLAGCSSVKQIPVLELEKHSENKIVSVEVRTIIREIILKDDERIVFLRDGGHYLRDRNTIEGLSSSDTLVSINLDNIRLITLEKELFLKPNSSLTDSSVLKDRNTLDTKLFRMRYVSQQLSDTSSSLVTSVNFDDEGAVFDKEEGIIRGMDEDRNTLNIPVDSVKSIVIRKLPKGVSRDEIIIRGGLSFSRTIDKDKMFSKIDSKVGNEFAFVLSTKYSKNLSSQLEFTYSKRSYDYTKSYTVGDVETEVRTDVKLTYADVSFITKYRAKSWNKYSLSFFIGPQLGYNIGGSGIYDSTNYDGGFVTGLRKKGDLINVNTYDTRMIIGGELNASIKNYGFIVDFRYSLGMNDIYIFNNTGSLLDDIWITNPDGSGVSIKKNSFSLTFGFKFPI